MDATASQKMQDLPPKGGYGPIQIERIKLRKLLGARSTIALFLTSTLAGFYGYYLNFLDNRREEIEMRSARFAIWPALLAERDRAVLKQLRRNRDEEAELMKNVESWEVGTYYGEPIFFLDEENKYREPVYNEYFAHVPANILDQRTMRHLLM